MSEHETLEQGADHWSLHRNNELSVLFILTRSLVLFL